MLFLALKKVQMIKNTLCKIPIIQQKILPAKFPIALTGMPLVLNAISKTKSFTFAQKEDFLEKLTNINITFVYLLFSRMVMCFIKNP